MPLEPTVSPREVGAHLGLGRTAIDELRRLGEQYGRELHPARGGLWPSFRAGHRTRRYPVAAIERHKLHLQRLITDPAYAQRQVERAARAGLGEVTLRCLERHLARATA